MRRRFARFGVVVMLTVGLVALVPLFAPSAMADTCSNTSLTINASCVSVPGVGTVTSAPTEPTSTGCVKDDCVTVNKGGTTLHKAEKPKGPPPAKKRQGTVKPATPTRGAVLGYTFLRHDNGPSDFYTGSFDNTLPLESEGWRNGIYRNTTPVIAEAPGPGMWSGITAPAAFTSFVLGTLLLVSAFSFKRLMLN
jgi:hypothetical protein